MGNILYSTADLVLFTKLLSKQHTPLKMHQDINCDAQIQRVLIFQLISTDAMTLQDWGSRPFRSSPGRLENMPLSTSS
jgi:hypothetical protein